MLSVTRASEEEIDAYETLCSEFGSEYCQHVSTTISIKLDTLGIFFLCILTFIKNSKYDHQPTELKRKGVLKCWMQRENWKTCYNEDLA